MLGLLSFVLLLFPSGQLISRRWRPVAWVASAATAAIGLSAAFEPRPLEVGALREVINPLGIQGAETVFEVLGTVVGSARCGMVLAAASMVERFRRARGDERQQLKWFAYAAVLSLLVWLMFIVPAPAAHAVGISSHQTAAGGARSASAWPCCATGCTTSTG